MNFPAWVQDFIRAFEPPKTGKVVLELEYYQGGVTKMEVGGIVRVKPQFANSMKGEKEND